MSTITEIAVTNAIPDRFSAGDVATLIAAIVAHLPLFCAEWKVPPPVVTYYPDRSRVPASSWEIALLDQPPAGDEGVEAFHDDPNGVPDGTCFAGWLLQQQGGGKWTGPLAVSMAYAHEVLEALRNPRCNLALTGPITGPDGKVYQTLWAEVCDPAQGGHIVYTVNGTEVWMPAFVTQSWEDPKGAPPFSVPEGVVDGAQKIGPEGYGGFGDASGNVSTVFAAKVHPAIRELKSRHGRLAEMAARAQSARVPSAA